MPSDRSLAKAYFCHAPNMSQSNVLLQRSLRRVGQKPSFAYVCATDGCVSRSRYEYAHFEPLSVHVPKAIYYSDARSGVEWQNKFRLRLCGEWQCQLLEQLCIFNAKLR